jgi:hypothetical protein
VIDGFINELLWAYAPFEELAFGGVPGVWGAPWTLLDDNLVRWKALWSPGSNKLYLAVFVQDDMAGTSDHNYDSMWQDDAVEIYTDGDRSGGGYSGSPIDAQQWMIRRDNAKHLIHTSGAYTGPAVQSAVQYYGDGNWSLEVAMEIYDQYNSNRKTLSVGDVIGWEVWYDDSDNEQQNGGLYLRDHQVGWAYSGPAWDNANYMAELEFAGVPDLTIVRFQVDMTNELPNVNPGDLIGVRGSHSPLSWNQTIPLVDPEWDNTYFADIDFTGITPGTVIEYKFVHHPPPDDNSTDVIYELDPGPNPPFYNREAALSGDTQILPLVYWNNDAASVEDEYIPLRSALFQNYPNPFNASTTIHFQLQNSSSMSLKVYNLMGKEVENLLEDDCQAGEYEVRWHANGVPSGIYLVQLKAEDFVETRKVVLQR